MIWDYDKWHVAAAKLVALISYPPESADEDLVMQYHSIVTLFEEATGKDLSSFKINDDRLKQKPVRRQIGGPPQMSAERYCDTRFFLAQLRSLANYMKTIRDDLVESQKDFMAKIRDPKPATQASGPHYSIKVDNMYNSALMQGSHDSTINQHFDMRSEEFKNFVGNLRTMLAQVTLADADRTQANADLSTVEAQIASPKPKHSVVRECMMSVRTILENAAGSLIATGAISAINQWFSV
jgi:hypothetical protein